MASLILKLSMSLDGYIAPADGSNGWEAAGRSDDGARWVLETVSNAETHLVGAAIYARWARSWPGAAGPFARPMNEIPKVVFSRTLKRAEWQGSRIARGELADEIAALKQESGKDLLAWGGATFAQSLSRLGLVDESRLVLQPIALGAGLPLFKDLTAPLRLELVEAQTYATGAALHIYRPIRD
jgi:dihydrofolate reductase